MFFRVISVIDRLPQALDRVTNSGSTEIDIGHGSECRLLCRFLDAGKNEALGTLS